MDIFVVKSKDKEHLKPFKKLRGEQIEGGFKLN